MHKWELIALPRCSLIYQVYSLKLSSLNPDWMSCFLTGLSNSPEAFQAAAGTIFTICFARRNVKVCWERAGAVKTRLWGRDCSETLLWTHVGLKLSAEHQGYVPNFTNYLTLSTWCSCCLLNVIYAPWLLTLWDCLRFHWYVLLLCCITKSVVIILFVLDNIFAMCLLI